MALQKPLVLIGGAIQQLPAGDTISAGTPIDQGIQYSFGSNEARSVPVNYQYLIKGRLLLKSNSILRITGQAVVI